MRLTGKTAIVSGAARGQGAAHVAALVEAGATVVGGDVRADEVDAVAEAAGDAAIGTQLDVTDPVSWAVAAARLPPALSPTTATRVRSNPVESPSRIASRTDHASSTAAGNASSGASR